MNENLAPVKRSRGNPNWYKGMAQTQSPHSGGRPATWQSPSVRAEYLVRKYSTAQIIAYAKLISDGKKTKISSPDAIIVVQLANVLQLRDGLERERLYDRLFGKVPDKVLNLNINLDATPSQLSERANALLQRIAPRELAPPSIEAEFEEDDSDLVDEGDDSDLIDDDSDLVSE